ncbi:DUF192 domain-containing protein [bacterium]|nr:DUF192 domain-containing protein [bacterium]
MWRTKLAVSLSVFNPRAQTHLVTDGTVADNFWARFIGLIGRKELLNGDGLLIDPCGSIHCMFMCIPIDVVYLDKENCVVGIDHALRPWRTGSFYRGAKRVIELPAGAANSTNTQVGDQLHVNIHPN